jgi:hypothetical protein
MFFSREGGGEECEKKLFFFRGEINTERHNLKQVYLVTATGIKKTPGGLFSRTDGFYIGLFSDRIHI